MSLESDGLETCGREKDVAPQISLNKINVSTRVLNLSLARTVDTFNIGTLETAPSVLMTNWVLSYQSTTWHHQLSNLGITVTKFERRLIPTQLF